MLERLSQYAQLMRWHKPIGFYLLLWPTLWGVWIAGQGQPSWQIVIIFSLGVIVMRSAGCVINDYADRDFDPHVARTQNRPIAAGHVAPKEALGLFAGLCVLALGLVLLLNPLTIALSLVAVVLTAIYPFMKRYTHFPQLVLGAAFAWSIPMAFAAQGNHVPLLAWALFAITLLWTVAYDTMYAMADREEDLQIGVKSTAIWLGYWDVAVVSALQAGVLIALTGVGWQLGFSPVYYAALAIAASLAVYQLWLIHDRQPQRCFQAFLNNNWLGGAVFIGIAAHYALQGIT